MPRFHLLPSTLAVALASQACGAFPLPPPPPPPRSMPDVPLPPTSPEAGMARVLISTDEPARVTQVLTLSATHGRYALHGTVEDLLCETTPCAVTMPYGDHELHLAATRYPERAGTVVVHVHESTVVVNHTLPRQDSPSGHAAGTALVVLGLLTAGGAAAAAPRANSDTFVGGMAGVGLVVALTGCALIGAYPRTAQPGATTEWSPAPAPVPSSASVGLSLGGRF